MKIHLAFANAAGDVWAACKLSYGDGRISTFWENVTCKLCMSRVCRCSYEMMILEEDNYTKELREREIIQGWHSWKGDER